MKITATNNLYNSSFKARNENIRKADKIVRETKHTFPSISPSYARSIYSVFKKDTPNQRAIDIRKKIDKNITNIRKSAEEYANSNGRISNNRVVSHYLAILLGLEKLKTGNCSEMCIATLGTLASKGYYNAHFNDLDFSVQIINKTTGETEYNSKYNIDHVFITASLDDKESQENTVIDPWLGFAESKSGAKEKYKKVFSKQIENYINTSTFEFEINKNLVEAKRVNWDNYEIRANFEFSPYDEIKENGLKEFGDYTNIMLH